ncbi:hypothetical protein HPP92_019636 [Vanilla planifolia]|uniref:Uncharacterized protein n=1 Tax=Vanilla planifolia TaxID=51239 RepID=A0A835UKY1_VANPL|nr:hypothetical protein HPP92_019636 [Vanilla planifolia]
MSTCGNCDCADKSHCVKKGNSYGIVIADAEKSGSSYAEEVFEMGAASENDGNCSCGSSCACSGCTCPGCTCGK